MIGSSLPPRVRRWAGGYEPKLQIFSMRRRALPSVAACACVYAYAYAYAYAVMSRVTGQAVRNTTFVPVAARRMQRSAVGRPLRVSVSVSVSASVPVPVPVPVSVHKM